VRQSRRFRLASNSATILLALLIAAAPVRAQAQNLRLIRDAEIENIIRIYATPLFQASGFSPQAIKVYLVRDSSLNAFATSGLRMFIHTGLLEKAEDPLEVIGVIAHETGHIASGHTVTRPEAARSASTTVIASYVLGLAAAFASGRSELGTAIIAGGQDIAIKNLLSYSRGQESAADQFAVNVLNGTEQSPRGLLEFLRLVGGQETLFNDQRNPYLRTHPVTSERIAFMEDQVKRSPYGQKPAPANLIALHARMRAKLFGFLDPLEQVLRRYPESDTSLPARYARATAYYRAGQTDKSLTLLNALIDDHPDDPYFRELKGQILFDNGRISEAVPEYETATRLLPRSSQLHLAAAHARLELDRPDQNDAALDHLRKTLRDEPGNSFAWRLTAIAYGRQGNVGMTALALAESANARGRAGEALEQAKRAQRILSEGNPAWLRAHDLERLSQGKVDKAAKKSN